MKQSAVIWALIVVAGLAPTMLAQEKSLERTFSIGATSAYRVSLTVRSELEGQRPVQIGAKTYVEPFSRFAEAQLSWRATRRVVALVAEGAADIEETLDDFDSPTESFSPENEEAQKMSLALRAALAQWATDRTLQHRETASGQLTGLRSEGVPTLGESAPPVLTLWLLRALRPTVTLPAVPVRFGERWQEPRAARLENWRDVRGSETGEWLDARLAGEPAVRLHVVQQIDGNVAAGPELSEAGAAQARFYGESISTLSLLTARLLSAGRSATREISWVLNAVPGLPEPQRFRARLSVQVRIEGCDDVSCLSPGDAARPALRKRP